MLSALGAVLTPGAHTLAAVAAERFPSAQLCAQTQLHPLPSGPPVTDLRVSAAWVFVLFLVTSFGEAHHAQLSHVFLKHQIPGLIRLRFGPLIHEGLQVSITSAREGTKNCKSLMFQFCRWVSIMN